MKSVKAQRLALARRSFLRSVGAGAAALPFFKLLEDSAVNAQMAAVPLRFVGFYHPHGVAAEHWNRRSGETDTNFDLKFAGSSLAPLDPFKDKLITMEGVDLAVGVETNTNGHDAAACILTGTGTPGGDKRPTNISIDQFLAREKGLGSATPFPTISLAVGLDDTSPGSTLSFAAGGQALPKIIDPVQTFDTYYAGLMTGTDAAAVAAAARRRRRNQSVIDYFKADVARLQTRLAQPERVKLDQHLTAMREIENRLTSVQPQGCVVPGKPVRSDIPKVQYWNGAIPYLDKITDLQLDLLAQAIGCGLTRFATILLSDPGFRITDIAKPLETNVHDTVAHLYSPDANDAARESQARLARLNLYYYTKLATLMQKLQAISALDSTLIMTFSDMGNPSLHSVRNIPFMLAGGANGKLRMGRRLVYASDCPPNMMWCNPPTTVSHNALLVSVCNLFGVDITSYGAATNPQFTKGPLPMLV